MSRVRAGAFTADAHRADRAADGGSGEGGGAAGGRAGPAGGRGEGVARGGAGGMRGGGHPREDAGIAARRAEEARPWGDGLRVVMRRFTDAPDPEAGEYPEID